jgi:uncharacterized protein YbjQ (UPF0145 family)
MVGVKKFVGKNKNKYIRELERMPTTALQALRSKLRDKKAAFTNYP